MVTEDNLETKDSSISPNQRKKKGGQNRKKKGRRERMEADGKNRVCIDSVLASRGRAFPDPIPPSLLDLDNNLQLQATFCLLFYEWQAQVGKLFSDPTLTFKARIGDYTVFASLGSVVWERPVCWAERGHDSPVSHPSDIKKHPEKDTKSKNTAWVISTEGHKLRVMNASNQGNFLRPVK